MRWEVREVFLLYFTSNVAFTVIIVFIIMLNAVVGDVRERLRRLLEG